jgi:tetratricopeptide (TPR) repeat protein
MRRFWQPRFTRRRRGAGVTCQEFGLNPSPSRRRTSRAKPARESKAPPGRHRRLFALAALLAVSAAVLLGTWRRPRSSTAVDEHVRQGLAAAEAGDNTAALEHLDAALAANPTHAQALLYRGQVAYTLGRVEEAREYFQRVPDAPANIAAAARYAEGVLLVSQGYARAGEALLRRAAAQNPGYLPPRERLVELYAVQMRRDEIRRELDAIRRLRPWSLEELVLYTLASERVARPEDGIRQLQSFLQAEPDDVDHQFTLALYLVVAERYDESAQLLESLLRRHPEDTRAAGMLAELYARQNDDARALLALARVGSSARPEFWYYRAAGRLWLRQGEWRLAADCLREAARLDPEDLTVAHQYGMALSRLDPEQAKVQFARSELLDRIMSQSARIPNRNHESVQPLIAIVGDVADALFQLERYREAAYWFDHVLMLDRTVEPAQRGLETAAARAQARKRQPQPAETPHAFASALEWSRLHENLRQAAERVRAEQPQLAREPAPGAIVLRDVHEEAGLDFQYFNGDTGFKYLLESMGGGVAVLDYDLDGWPDLYFPQGCAIPYQPDDVTHQDRLFRNRGDGRFDDVTQWAGLGDNRYGQGCAVGDYDNDGDPDLFVANYGQSVLYRNNGDGTFSDATNVLGLTKDHWASSAGFADLDCDGALDLYVATYVDSLKVCRAANGQIATCDPDNFTAEQDLLFHNREDGTFAEVAQASGIHAPDGKGLGLMVADFDRDSWPDVYVANDGTPNFLFRNKSQPGKLAFEEIAGLAGVAVNGDGQAEGSMGIACADLDGDSQLDLYVTNFVDEQNTAYRNLGQMFFQDASRQTGLNAISLPMVGFGVQPMDLDWDGRPDLLVANGHIDDFRFRNERWKMPTQVFRNVDAGKFEDASAAAGPYFKQEFLGRGVARLDWDKDGDEDAVVVHQDAPLALLSNETPNQGHWLAFRLHGVTSNRDGVGAKLEVHTSQAVQHGEMVSGDGFYASNERRISLGLGGVDSVDRVVIRWPSGVVQEIAQPQVDMTHDVLERSASGSP